MAGPRPQRVPARLVIGKSVTPGAIWIGSLSTIRAGMSAGRAPVVNVTGSAAAVCPAASVAETVSV